MTMLLSSALQNPPSGPAALKFFWDQGLQGRALLEAHTKFVDDFVRSAFDGCPAKGKGHMALVALGGYGRQELFPFSDIDLLLLYSPDAESDLSCVTRDVFYPLWDSGAEVGHGVRTVGDCLDDAQKDFFFQVSLLDARLICGDETLFNDLVEAFKASFVEGNRKTFTEQMLAHRAERHRRFGDHAYLLEPNIKECRGGLRDLQSMLWTAKVLFGLEDLSALEREGLLTPEEHEACQRAWEDLIRIRNRLHHASGRKNDRLYFEYQQEIAKAFGHGNAEGLLGVEHFMRLVHGHLHQIAVVSDLFFEHVDEVLNPIGCGTEDHILEPGVEILKCRLHLTGLPLRRNRLHIMMRIFARAAQTGIPLHHGTKRTLRAHRHLIDDRARRSKRMAKAFLETLRGDAAAQALEAMLDTGVLEAYIPEFAPIHSLAQYDVYHAYTVDRHVLQAVAEAHRLRESEAQVFGAVKSPHILFLAALLHDIGKGQGGGHAERGAVMAAEIGARLGLPPEELDALTFLVRQHLFLTDTAMRRDLEDETFIVRCARKIVDLDRLNMLYLLSIADARATGPHAWNDWKAALLLELYLKIAHLLERGDLMDPDRVQAVEWMRQQVAERLGPEAEDKLALLPEDYLLNFSPETILHHLELKERIRSETVILAAEDKGPYWSLLVVARDKTGLLSKICGVLALHNLSVLSAQIFTLKDGVAMDVLNVQPVIEEALRDVDWEALRVDLGLAIEERLGLAHRLAGKPLPLGASPHQPDAHPQTQAVIDNKTSDFYTVIEVYAGHRTGMLYNITRTLADFGVNIFRAKIGTSADKIVDCFYVLDKVGQKIEDPALQKELRNALLFAAGA